MGTTETMSAVRRPSAAWLYLASAGFSLLGNGVATVVWPWLVLQRTGDPAAAGVVATAIALPSLLFALVGGHLIDTFGRKLMSVISDIISGVSVIAVIAVDNWFGLNLAWFIIIGILGAVGDIPGMAARSALAGDVSYTSGKTLDFISGINQTLIGLAFLVGPALAGMLMSALPIQQVLWITAACSLIAALLTALLRLEANPTDIAEENLTGWRNWVSAWATILKQPMIQLLAVFGLVTSALIAPYLMIILPAHFQSTNDPKSMGLAISAYAVGIIVGGGIVAALGTTRRRLIWTVSIALFSIGFCLMVVLDNNWFLMIGTGIAGLGAGIGNPLQMILVTEEIPENLRGRAFSVFNAIGQFSAPVGLVAATAALTRTSIYTLAIAAAAIWVISSLYFAVRGVMIMPMRANYDDEHEPAITD